MIFGHDPGILTRDEPPGNDFDNPEPAQPELFSAAWLTPQPLAEPCLVFSGADGGFSSAVSFVAGLAFSA